MGGPLKPSFGLSGAFDPSPAVPTLRTSRSVGPRSWWRRRGPT